jgi:hypothetical protein
LEQLDLKENKSKISTYYVVNIANMTYKKLYVIAGCNGAGKTTGFGFSDAKKNDSCIVFGLYRTTPKFTSNSIETNFLNGLVTPIRLYFRPQLDLRANLGLIFILSEDALIVFFAKIGREASSLFPDRF